MNLGNLKAESFNKKYIGIGFGKNAMSSNAEKDTVANVNLRRETILTDSYNGGEDIRFFFGELFVEKMIDLIRNTNDNFWKATKGKAEISFDQLDLLSKATLTPIGATNSKVTSPSNEKPIAEIVGGRKIVIADTDGAADESGTKKKQAPHRFGTNRGYGRAIQPTA